MPSKYYKVTSLAAIIALTSLVWTSVFLIIRDKNMEIRIFNGGAVDSYPSIPQPAMGMVCMRMHMHSLTSKI